MQTQEGDRTGSVLLTAHLSGEIPWGDRMDPSPQKKYATERGHGARVALELSTLGYSGSLQDKAPGTPEGLHHKGL